MEQILFSETATLGIRRSVIQRSIQNRDTITVTTPWGTVSGKRGWRTGSTPTFAPEFEDCVKLARQHSVPLRDVYRAAESAFLQMRESGTLPLAMASGSETPDGHHHDHSHDHDTHSHDHDSHSHDHDSHDHDSLS